MRRALIALGLLTASNAFAALEQRGQAWVLAMAQAKAGALLVYVEVQPRVTFAPATQLDQVISRIAVGYQLHPRVSVWVGAAYIGVTNESRIYQQVSWNWTVGSVKFLVRGRLEQRFIPTETDPQPDDPKLRLRVQPRVQWTFADPFLLIASDELMVNFTPGAFDQNRAYVALGYRPHPEWLLELGYLNQLTATRMAHTPMLTLGAGF